MKSIYELNARRREIEAAGGKEPDAIIFPYANGRHTALNDAAPCCLIPDHVRGNAREEWLRGYEDGLADRAKRNGGAR